MSDPDNFIVKAEDVRAAGYCIVPGLKGFLEERSYNLRDFIKNGLPASVFVGFNDARSERVLTKARERIRG